MASGRLNGLRASPLTKTVSVCAERVKRRRRPRRPKETSGVAGFLSYPVDYPLRRPGARRDGGTRRQRIQARSPLPDNFRQPPPTRSAQPRRLLCNHDAHPRCAGCRRRQRAQSRTRGRAAGRCTRSLIASALRRKEESTGWTCPRVCMRFGIALDVGRCCSRKGSQRVKRREAQLFVVGRARPAGGCPSRGIEEAGYPARIPVALSREAGVSSVWHG